MGKRVHLFVEIFFEEAYEVFFVGLALNRKRYGFVWIRWERILCEILEPWGTLKYTEWNKKCQDGDSEEAGREVEKEPRRQL